MESWTKVSVERTSKVKDKNVHKEMGRMTRQEKLKQIGQRSDTSRIICNIETSPPNTKIRNLPTLQSGQTPHFHLVPFSLTSINWSWTRWPLQVPSNEFSSTMMISRQGNLAIVTRLHNITGWFSPLTVFWFFKYLVSYQPEGDFEAVTTAPL